MDRDEQHQEVRFAAVARYIIQNPDSVPEEIEEYSDAKNVAQQYFEDLSDERIEEVWQIAKAKNYTKSTLQLFAEYIVTVQNEDTGPLGRP